jgi:hypothetical protein
VVSDINVTAANGTKVPYNKVFADQNIHVEDPFLWVDKRGNFHIINHAYDDSVENCYTSTLSAHVFSPDGKDWHVLLPRVEPYSHTVEYDDGTSFTFVALERPNLHFDQNGTLTHINLAADLTTTNAGCNGNGAASQIGNGGQHACDYCKFLNHCGTTIIALDA